MLVGCTSPQPLCGANPKCTPSEHLPFAASVPLFKNEFCLLFTVVYSLKFSKSFCKTDKKQIFLFSFFHLLFLSFWKNNRSGLVNIGKAERVNYFCLFQII